MIQQNDMQAGRFCWIDLATSNAPGATAFYRDVFGWAPREQAANGGSFTRLQLADRDVGSLYQLSRAQVEQGAPSHWTPYVGVDDIDDAVHRAVAAGGKRPSVHGRRCRAHRAHRGCYRRASRPLGATCGGNGEARWLGAHARPGVRRPTTMAC